MKVKINPARQEQGSGLTAFASWDNPDLQRAIETAFRVDRKREQIESIEVTEDGITLRLETKVCLADLFRFTDAKGNQ